MNSDMLKKMVIASAILILGGIAAINGVVIFALKNNSNSDNIIAITANTNYVSEKNEIITIGNNSDDNDVFNDNFEDDIEEEKKNILIVKNINEKEFGDIKTYAIKTRSRFNEDVDFSQYVIQNETELDAFLNLYKGAKNSIIETDFNENVIFIKTLVRNSGGTIVQLDNINIDNGVEFEISNPIIGVTDDVTYWYIEAIIPRDRVYGINVDDWVSPLDE